MKTLVPMIAAACLVVACSKAPEPVAPVREEPTVDQMLAAMVRGHPHSRRVCYEAIRIHAFFIEYSPAPEGDAPKDTYFHGWQFIENVDFYRASNNSWFITNLDSNKYNLVYPDVDNLKCLENTNAPR